MPFNGLGAWAIVARYGAAVTAIAGIVSACSLIGGVATERPFIPLFVTALAISVSAGPGPGALATILGGLLGDYFFLAPIGSLWIDDREDMLRLAFYLVTALLAIAGVVWHGRKKRAELINIREQAGETLRDSEERYRLLFQTSREGIATYDTSGRLQDANPAYLAMVGYSLDELRTLTFRDLTPERWHESYKRVLRECSLPKSNSEEYEKECIRKDGSIIPVSLRAWPVFDSKQTIIGFRAFVRDISARKRVEESLKAADRRKDEFLATLAHELRNPLAPIRNSVHLLKQSQAITDERNRKLLAIADRQVAHLVRLVNELLDFSRISGGKIDLQREKIDLLEILRHAIETAQPVIELGGHSLETSFSEANLTVHADPVRLTQVFTNLLDNAAKYTEHGGVIALAAAREGDEAVVTVRDSGVGIPAEMLPEIFDYFRQSDRTLGRAKGGLGIGLALVRSLLHLHGGTVEAQSAGEGCGSVFTVRLPLVSEVVSSATAPALPARAPRRVLIIDDERDVADSFAELLASFGATTRVAYCCDAGLEAFTSFRPELVLLDLGMPAPDGFETARRIRALPEGRDVMLVALSGWGKAQVAERMQTAGFDSHLTKPAELRALNELLATLGSKAGSA